MKTQLPLKQVLATLLTLAVVFAGHTTAWAQTTITQNTTWANGTTFNNTVTISGGTEANPIIITVAGTVTLTDGGEIKFGAGAHVRFQGSSTESSKFVQNSTQPSMFMYDHRDENVRATIQFENLTMDFNQKSSGLWFYAGSGAPMQVDFTNTVIKNANISSVMINVTNCFAHFHNGTKITGNNCHILIQNGQTESSLGQFTNTFYLYNGCEISNNTCSMYLLDGNLYNNIVMYGGTISNNTISGTSGALVSLKLGVMDIYGGNIENNTAPTYMIQNYRGTLNVYGGSFTGNTAGNGGILMNLSYVSNTVTSLATTNIYDGTFSNNIATSGGGAIWNNRYSILNLYGGTFSGNTSSGNGGAIYSSGVLNIAPAATAYMENGVSKTSSGILSVTGNTATNTGGGIAMGTTGELTLGGPNITISGNISTNDKGANLTVLSGIPATVTSALGNSTIYYSMVSAIGVSGAYTIGKATTGYGTCNSNADVNEHFHLEQDGYMPVWGSSTEADYVTRQEIWVVAVQTTTLTVAGYGESTKSDHWAFIASPVADGIAIGNVTHLVAGTATEYDLYRLNPSNTMWENSKNTTDHPDFTTLVNGKGYLYANKNDVQLVFTGTPNTAATQAVPLNEGWNLVGNPFAVAAYANRAFYKMNAEGTGVEAVDAYTTTTIPACTGVVVVATGGSETVTFSTTAPELSNGNGSLNIVLTQAVADPSLTRFASSNAEHLRGTKQSTLDNAIVSFNEGSQLGKFHFLEQAANISISQGGEEYAIVSVRRDGVHTVSTTEIPINFTTRKDGEYTIAVNPEGVEMGYLHLIDNLTGTDVDLLPLCTPLSKGAGGLGRGDSTHPAEYTFTAKTTDYASRFRLVFSADGDVCEPGFAFVSNGEIIITGVDGDAGTASLQVVDVLGRVLVCTDVARNVSTAGMTPGVYVLRLICGDDVRTQKIIIP